MTNDAPRARLQSGSDTDYGMHNGTGTLSAMLRPLVCVLTCLRRNAFDAQGIRRAPQASPSRRAGRGWSASGTRSSPTPPEIISCTPLEWRAGMRPKENDTHSSNNSTLVVGIAVLTVAMG